MFDLLMFWLIWWYLGPDTPQEQAAFRAVWFTDGVLSQVLVLLLLHTRARRPARPVMLTVAAVVAAGVTLPFTALVPMFGMAPPPASVSPLLAVVVPPFLLCAAATQSLYLHHVLGIHPADKDR